MKTTLYGMLLLSVVSSQCYGQWKNEAQYQSTLQKIHMKDYKNLNEFCMKKANKIIEPEKRFREKSWCRSKEFKVFLKTQYNQARLEKSRNDYFQSQAYQVLLSNWKKR